MASWLKAAEDLFEVVDRRAKLVVNDLSDEQLAAQSLEASNGPGSQVKPTKKKTKAQRRQAINKTSEKSSRNKTESPETSGFVHAPINIPTPKEDPAPEKGSGFLNDDNGTASENSAIQTINEQQKDLEKESGDSIPKIETPGIGVSETDAGKPEVAPIPADREASPSTSNGELVNEILADGREEHPLPEIAKEVDIVYESNPVQLVDAGQDNRSQEAGVSTTSDQERSKCAATDVPSNRKDQIEVADGKEELERSKQSEHKAGSSPIKVNEQEQLEEAQGLLKTAVSLGQSKEARLARVCAGLSSRLQEYKSENAQLEELLVSERELSKSYEAHIKQLQKDCSSSKSEVTRIESNMVEALAAKNSEIEALVSSMDVLKKQAAISEGNLASMQANMDAIMRNRELTETRMMQAVREELASVERRAEEERAAHNATKLAAMEREVELEHRALEASTALARTQRIADERTAKAADLEQKMALLEVECANLNQELQDMEARVRRGQKKLPEEASQMIQVWQEEVESAHQSQRDAEGKLSSLEAEAKKMRVEIAAMKRDAEHYSRQEHMELEKRYRDLTDLLYYKQTQLETMASEKAAAEFHLEKELKRIQEAQVEAERSRVPRRASASWVEDTEMKALEPLPLYHRHMVGATMQIQKAAKLLDSGAVRATKFLWRYPTARIILLFYLVFVHMFLMFLLHRLQAQDDFSAREVAQSMGLTNTSLP